MYVAQREGYGLSQRLGNFRLYNYMPAFPRSAGILVALSHVAPCIISRRLTQTARTIVMHVTETFD